MSTSKLQRYVSQQLSIYFGGYIIRENYRPDWLNAGNGGNLEIDFYIEELNLAIEVQGEQHWRFVPLFHQDKNGYNAQIERDKKKKQICLNKGLKFVEIFTEEDIHSLIKNHFYIEEYKPEKLEKKRTCELIDKQKIIDLQRERKTIIKEQKRLMILENQDSRFKKDILFIKERAADLDKFKNKKPLNRVLRRLEKRLGRSKFIEFIRKTELPEVYLFRIFDDY